MCGWAGGWGGAGWKRAVCCWPSMRRLTLSSCRAQASELALRAASRATSSCRRQAGRAGWRSVAAQHAAARQAARQAGAAASSTRPHRRRSRRSAVDVPACEAQCRRDLGFQALMPVGLVQEAPNSAARGRRQRAVERLRRRRLRRRSRRPCSSQLLQAALSSHLGSPKTLLKAGVTRGLLAAAGRGAHKQQTSNPRRSRAVERPSIVTQAQGVAEVE